MSSTQRASQTGNHEEKSTALKKQWRFVTSTKILKKEVFMFIRSLKKGTLTSLASAAALMLSCIGYANAPAKQDIVSTNAGNYDFSLIARAQFPGIFHKFVKFHPEENLVELDNGSLWLVSKPNVVNEWVKGDNLVLSQNHLTVSTYRFSLINTDRKLAVPISLVREPMPAASDKSNLFFIKHVDLMHDCVTLNSLVTLLVYSSDHGTLNKFSDHDRLIVGINSSDKNGENPYILIDTAVNTYVRAKFFK